MAEKIIDIEQLAQDQHNFNKGTEQGQELMERSFKEMGAGRSILIDRNGNIIAGNKSQKAAIAAGIKKVRIIETTGDELVAVKRTDVDIDSAEGRKMAYLDNLTTQVNLTWDVRAPFTHGGGEFRAFANLVFPTCSDADQYIGLLLRFYSFDNT